MRFVIAAATAALLLVPMGASLAQTATAPAAGTETPAAPGPAAPIPAAPAPAAPAPGGGQGQQANEPPPASGKPATKKTAHRHRQTMQQHFDAANTSKDGHLTLDQVKTAHWSYVERHFSAMDKDHKGYVTAADIHAYAVSARAARHHHTGTTAPAAAPGETQGAAPGAAPTEAPGTAQTPE